jgi:2',3'-cyclic-nucleotide 2'-phosphodiesterase (5'-nucleotidase family)
MARLVVFHTSDMHNKLTSEVARRLTDLKQREPSSLMLDSGDAIWAGNIFWRPGGEPILGLMSEVPYDAMCAGNREFHLLHAGLTAKMSRARFPILCANIRASGRASIPAVVKDRLLVDIDGVCVGLIGITVPCVTERMAVKRVADYYFVNPLDAATEVVREVRSKCDLLIALTHVGIAKDTELAEKIRGIDLILGGHTHTITDQPKRVGNTVILHHGAYAKSVGRVVIETASSSVVISNELIPLSGTADYD